MYITIQEQYINQIGNFLYFSGCRVIHPAGEWFRKDLNGTEYHLIVFVIADTIAGSVRVYSYNSIMVTYIMDHKSQSSFTDFEIFQDPETTIEFLRKKFLDWEV